MRLYFFETGTLTTSKSLIVQGGEQKDITAPVLFYLIEHPKGKVLFDTGLPIQISTDPRSYWGDVIDAYTPKMNKDQFIVNQLEKLGIKPEEISYVIVSHLHSDHAGGIGFFPNAKYIIQRKELEWAYVPDFYQKSVYLKTDFDKDVEWMFLEGWRDDNYDLFGDGKVNIIYTPGHTPGQQSVFLRFDSGNNFILTSDACYVDEILKKDSLAALFWNPSEFIRSINRIKRLSEKFGASIITGHEPNIWKTYKKSPEFYD